MLDSEILYPLPSLPPFSSPSSWTWTVPIECIGTLLRTSWFSSRSSHAIKIRRRLGGFATVYCRNGGIPARRLLFGCSQYVGIHPPIAAQPNQHQQCNYLLPRLTHHVTRGRKIPHRCLCLHLHLLLHLHIRCCYWKTWGQVSSVARAVPVPG